MSVVPSSPAVPPTAASAAVVAERRNAFRVVIVTLVVAAAALNWVVPHFQISFRKEAVAPRQPLKMVRTDLGPWAQVSVDRALDPDTEHELGAQQYLTRTYVDTRLLSPADAKAMTAAPVDDREKLVAKLGGINPKAVVHLMVTYYTGSVDTVPHVPDRCYVADGYKPSTYEVVQWPVLPRENPADRNVGVRLIDFEDQIDSRHSHPTQVAYFFQVNGVYENDPIFGVRKRLQNLFDRRAYFAKIELRTDLDTSAEAQSVLTDFLQHAMPDIERVLPDWSAPTNAPATAPAAASASASASSYKSASASPHA